MKGFRKLGEPLFAQGLTSRLRVGTRMTAGGAIPDTTAPTCTITCNETSPTSAATMTFTYTFSEDVSGFETGDAGIAGGTKGTFTPVSASVYTLVVTPTAYSVVATVAAGVCTDAAGNNNTEATPLTISSLLFWFLAGAVPAANCIIAYQPIGAASLAASKVNKANPGTYDAVAGTNPNFNTATGWQFVAAGGTYLDTQWVPPNQVTRSGIARFSGATVDAAGRWAFSSRNGGPLFGFQNTNASSVAGWSNGSGAQFTHSTNLAAGVVAIAGLKSYLNGTDLGSITAGTYDMGTIKMWIGCLNNGGSATQYFDGYEQAVAFYDITLSPAQVTAITTAMNSLP